MSCRATPTLVANATGTTFTSLVASGEVNMAVGADGKGYVWGDGGPFDMFNFGVPPAVVLGGTSVLKFVTGMGGVCVLSPALWSCIDRGNNKFGTPIAGDPGFVQMATGADHLCGLTAAGSAYCWGYGGWGQLGLATDRPVYRYTPSPVVGGHQFVSIAVGYQFTCAVDLSTKLYCWGGGLPGTPVADPGTPQLRESAIAFTQIVAGFHFLCGISTERLLYCFGENRNGELGDGTTVGRLTFVHVKVLAP